MADLRIKLPEKFDVLYAFVVWRYKVFEGGRSSAKSWSIAAAAADAIYYNEVASARAYRRVCNVSYMTHS